MGNAALANPLKKLTGCAEQTFSLARSRQDLTHAFRLSFESYYDAGLVNEKPSGIRLTPYHLLPTTEVIIAKVDGVITSTISLIGDGYLGLPMQSMYSDEIKELRDQGLKVGEIGCLADRRHAQTRFIETFAKMGRLLAQVAFVRGMDVLVAATHPKHARLYQRVLGFERMGKQTDCPYANDNPAVALKVKFDEHVGTPLYQQYFGQSLPQRELAPYRWDRATRQHFKKVLERDNEITSLAGVEGYYNWAVLTGTLTSN